jgi:curved DNA-binding protein CbpA
MSGQDPYKILQVDPEAEDEVIEAAYRRLARKYHPDISPGPESQARMVRINQAWDLLRDPGRRAAVDRARKAPSGRDAGRPGGPTGVAGHASPAATSFTGPSDRGTAHPGPRPQQVSPDMGPGRSSAGSGYDPTTMGSPGHAGPPPGKPSGSVLNFGRYAGWSLGEIARTDLEYLEWLDRMPIGRSYQAEVDGLLRARGRRVTARPDASGQRGLFRRR